MNKSSLSIVAFCLALAGGILYLIHGFLNLSVSLTAYHMATVGAGYYFTLLIAILCQAGFIVYAVSLKVDIKALALTGGIIIAVTSLLNSLSLIGSIFSLLPQIGYLGGVVFYMFLMLLFNVVLIAVGALIALSALSKRDNAFGLKLITCAAFALAFLLYIVAVIFGLVNAAVVFSVSPAWIILGLLLLAAGALVSALDAQSSKSTASFNAQPTVQAQPAAQAQAPMEGAQAQPAAPKFCSGCGAPIAEGSSFCSGCGRPLGQ